MGISRDNRTLTLLHHVLVTWLPSPPNKKEKQWSPWMGRGEWCRETRAGKIRAHHREPEISWDFGNGGWDISLGSNHMDPRACRGLQWRIRELLCSGDPGAALWPPFLQYGFVVLNRIFHFWHIKTSRKMWTNGVPRGARVVDNSFWWSAGDQEFSKIESSFENPPRCVSQRRSFHFCFLKASKKSQHQHLNNFEQFTSSSCRVSSTIR